MNGDFWNDSGDNFGEHLVKKCEEHFGNTFGENVGKKFGKQIGNKFGKQFRKKSGKRSGRNSGRHSGRDSGGAEDAFWKVLTPAFFALVGSASCLPLNCHRIYGGGAGRGRGIVVCGGRVKAGKGTTRACRGEKQSWQKQLKQEMRKPVL